MLFSYSLTCSRCLIIIYHGLCSAGRRRSFLAASYLGTGTGRLVGDQRPRRRGSFALGLSLARGPSRPALRLGRPLGSKWPWNMIHSTPCRKPCRLSIHLCIHLLTLLVPQVQCEVANLDHRLLHLFQQWECLKCHGHGLPVSCVKWPSLTLPFARTPLSLLEWLPFEPMADGGRSSYIRRNNITRETKVIWL